MVQYFQIIKQCKLYQACKVGNAGHDPLHMNSEPDGNEEHEECD